MVRPNVTVHISLHHDEAVGTRTTLREVLVEVRNLPERYQLSGETLSDLAETSGPMKDTDAMTEGNHVPEQDTQYRTVGSYT